MEDGWKKSTFTSNEAEMVDRLLYSLDLAIRRTGRVTRPELDKVITAIVGLSIISFYPDLQPDREDKGVHSKPGLVGHQVLRECPRGS